MGRAGEHIAERHLRALGWRLIARRLKTPQAEVDLVLRTPTALVCVEVKTGRHGPRFRPGQRLDRRQLERLRRASRNLARRPGYPARVDLVEVLLGRGRPTVVHHRDLREPIEDGDYRAPSPLA